jgi:hypothetical protein
MAENVLGACSNTRLFLTEETRIVHIAQICDGFYISLETEIHEENVLVATNLSKF